MFIRLGDYNLLLENLIGPAIEVLIQNRPPTTRLVNRFTPQLGILLLDGRIYDSGIEHLRHLAELISSYQRKHSWKCGT